MRAGVVVVSCVVAIIAAACSPSDPQPTITSNAGSANGGEHADTVPEGERSVSGELTSLAYRLLVEDVDAGDVYVTDVAATESELMALWFELELGERIPTVDFQSSVVFYFGAVESSSCPLGPIQGLIYNARDLRIYPNIPINTLAGAVTCTSDANRHALLVAVERVSLPDGGFSLWINADDPPGCCLDGQTLVAPGELTARLGSDGLLPVGESRIAYDVGTHCGVEWLSVTINGQFWRATNLDTTDATGIDPVPTAWGHANQSLDLIVTLLDAANLEVTSPSTGVTVTYIPDPSFPACF